MVERESLGHAALEMLEKTRATFSMQLSEENLRIHNARPSKDDGEFQINLIQEERARVLELEMFRGRGGSVGELDTNVVDEQRASEALKLYSSHLPSAESPMDRFTTMGPTQDPQPWMAQEVMDEAGIGYGDLETLHLRKLVSELAASGLCPGPSQKASMGSLLSSSDTLPVAQAHEIPGTGTEGARVRERTGLRGHNRGRGRGAEMPRSCSVDK
ncbi:hypothetical protein BDV95DRAFT_594723 [Massariosphaeria phaeospora]|uniref:Uncharacterized protein n=1 Tax=Massariosphaeria phaeospora TaxID=100035 RepID=A0A7C8IDV0_9PLEO|nr:hypothetical protein BDV95DRAFT_594723 [Massariosphaeria phaeospora]